MKKFLESRCTSAWFGCHQRIWQTSRCKAEWAAQTKCFTIAFVVLKAQPYGSLMSILPKVDTGV